MKYASIRTLAPLLAIGMMVSDASALTVTGNLNVQITITQDCQVSAASSLIFPNRGVLNADTDGQTAASGSGAIQVQCSSGTPYRIGLNGGVNSTIPGSFLTRRMASGGSFVTYQLYQDAGRTTVWGDDILNLTTVSATANGAQQSYQVFGRVPAQTTPPPGTYTDTVTVTVTY